MLRELSVAEQRYQAVLAVIEDDVEVTVVAEKHGVTRQTVHSWLSRYAVGGPCSSACSCNFSHLPECAVSTRRPVASVVADDGCGVCVRLAPRIPSAMPALRHRRYRAFVGGALIAGTGNWMLRLAQALLVVDATDGSASAVGLLATVQYAPVLFVGPIAGAVADRRSKPLVLAAGQLLMAAAAIAQAFAPADGPVAVPVIFVLAFVFGAGGAIDNTLRLTLAPELVPPEAIINAVSLNTVFIQMGRLLGPAAGGLLVAALGYPPVFLLGALGFVAFVVILIALNRRSTSPPVVADRSGGGVLEGLRYAGRNPELLLIFGLVGIGGLLGPNLATLSTLMVHDVFGGGPAQLGGLTSLLAVGTVLGALFTARRSALRLRDVVIASCLVGVTSAAAALAPTPLAYGLLLLPAGMAALTMVTTASALLQLTVPGEYRGRVTALYSVLLVIGVPLGSPILGWLADALGIRTSILIGSAVVLAVAAGLGLVARARVAVVLPSPAEG